MKIIPLCACLFLGTNSVFGAASLGSKEAQEAALKKQMPLINKALKKGLGITPSSQDKIKMVAGGFSKADLFIVTIASKTKAKVEKPVKDYIIKIMHDSPAADIETEAFATKLAGDAGAGPAFHYASVDEKIILRDSVGNAYDNIDRHDTPFHKKVAKKVRAFHDEGLKTAMLNRTESLFDILRQDAQRLVDHKMVGTFATQVDEYYFLSAMKEVEAVFSHFKDDIRPVHHDLSPHNLMYDGQEAWLIDWETASNDYYPIDLCMFANFHIYDESKLFAFLETYYGRAPTELELAKFHVIRPFCYAFHGYRLAFLSDFKERPNTDNILEYKKFQLALRRGEIKFGPPSVLYRLGMSTMNRAITMIKDPDFKKGLALLKVHIQKIKEGGLV